MTLLDIKKKVLQLIEEISDTEDLTSDPDIKAKLNSVINMVQFELARMKKIPAVSVEEVTDGQLFDMNTLENFYQSRLIRFDGAYELVENIAVFNGSGTATFYYYKYPEAITDETPDTYEFELSQDALEILPYGVASDILKSDVSTNYGAIYSQRYETMLQRLDPRYSMGGITIEGGIDV
jgi:hypothetical protein